MGPIFIAPSSRFGGLGMPAFNLQQSSSSAPPPTDKSAPRNLDALMAAAGATKSAVKAPAPNPLLLNPAGQNYTSASDAAAAQARWNAQQALNEQMRLDNERAAAAAADLERRRAAQWELDHAVVPKDISWTSGKTSGLSSNTMLYVGGAVALIGLGLYWKYG